MIHTLALGPRPPPQVTPSNMLGKARSLPRTLLWNFTYQRQLGHTHLRDAEAFPPQYPLVGQGTALFQKFTLLAHSLALLMALLYMVLPEDRRDQWISWAMNAWTGSIKYPESW
jgi:hypothetical protein